MQGALPGQAAEASVVVAVASSGEIAFRGPWVQTAAATDYTVQWRAVGLTAGTRYNVTILCRADSAAPVSAVAEGAFVTAPAPSSAEPVRFCVLSCHEFPLRDAGLKGHRVYGSMSALNPHFAVHTGDIEYYDRPEPYALSEDLARFKWQRLFALPLQRKFYSYFGVYNQKDDHDVLRDDAEPGMMYGSLTYERGLALFDEEQFPRRPAGSPTYLTQRWGKHLQVWLLENRNYRHRAAGTVLGDEQKAWLKETLPASNATFKIVITPTPVLGPDHDWKSDNLANGAPFHHDAWEVKKLLLLTNNTFVVSGDRHWQYASVDERSIGSVWEFGTGAAADKHSAPAAGSNMQSDGVRRAFVRWKGGFLEVEISETQASACHETVGDMCGAVEARFTHRDVDGTAVHTKTFRA